jgi:hypothetical protein
MYAVNLLGGEMTYDMQLGLLATQAVTDLLRGEAQQDDAHYRTFLLKSADFCRSVRESLSSISLPSSTSKEVAAFISAVMSLSEARSSERERERLSQISQIEPLIVRVLNENRRPNADEQVQIAEVLYSASAADFE